MTEAGMTFGSSWPVDYFETELRAKHGTLEFDFAMLALREAIKWSGHGHYLISERSGQLWRIAAANEVESISQQRDEKIKRDMRFVVELRSSTLANPKAELSDSERRKLEAGLEKASLRLALVCRQKSVCNFLAKKAPKLLK